MTPQQFVARWRKADLSERSEPEEADPDEPVQRHADLAEERPGRRLTAHGWPPELTDEKILTRLLDLNQAQAGAGG